MEQPCTWPKCVCERPCDEVRIEPEFMDPHRMAYTKTAAYLLPPGWKFGDR